MNANFLSLLFLSVNHLKNHTVGKQGPTKADESRWYKKCDREWGKKKIKLAASG